MVHLEHFSDHPLDYITEFYTAERVRIDSCPHCHSRRRLHLHGIYHRHVIWYEDVFSIPVQRHYCIHCGKTVSILPSFCHSGFQLALPFLLELLWAFFKRIPSGCALAHQHRHFITRRFLFCLNRLIEYFRICHDPLIVFPDFWHEKAIKLLEMVQSVGKPHIFAKRYYDHFKIGFMAL
ncbi:hypothetical protein DSECCO2_48090 [anaerobic digester metagenome]|jgi:hypothetical protein|uniref:transposase n=1 Tax=Acetobacterium sp. UBA5834 TaxID=1945907 RepID=UPI00257C4861|nr:transposase [Acetobacterium sp. UBA5834]